MKYLKDNSTCWKVPHHITVLGLVYLLPYTWNPMLQSHMWYIKEFIIILAFTSLAKFFCQYFLIFHRIPCIVIYMCHWWLFNKKHMFKQSWHAILENICCYLSITHKPNTHKCGPTMRCWLEGQCNCNKNPFCGFP